MTSLSAYNQLLNHVKQTSALGQIAGVLSWDQEVMMPPNGASMRAEQMGALAVVSHAHQTDPRIGEWLDQIDEASLSNLEKSNTRLVRKSYQRSIKIPASLSEELARTTSQAQSIWARARAANSYADFAPSLSKIVDLKRQEAKCLADSGASLYDALLNDFEPGMTTSVLQPLLENMRPRLTALREKIAESNHSQPTLTGPFDTDAQMKLARSFADVVGYNWDSGRLDLSVHPFSSGTGNDSRITTRVDADDPLDCLYSTLHELGHALYEQGLPQDVALEPICSYVSMGVHESQSRLWENKIGRSKAFCTWLWPKINEAFGAGTVTSADELYRIINRVETGFIRTESDEVHYNLHVLLRFELERDLISGSLEVADLEIEWNRRFKRDFGISVPDAAHGVLQDVHWSAGMFGYFPTYSLGNIYAAQLNDTLRKAAPDLDEEIAAGKTETALHWLRENIHQKGSLVEPNILIEQVVSQKISAEPLLHYLEDKYSELFAL
jgi:carboxypeptidase Taq